MTWTCWAPWVNLLAMTITPCLTKLGKQKSTAALTTD